MNNGTDYTFEVRAVNPVGNGPASGDTATPNPVPAAPGSFNAAPDDRRVALSWDDPSDSSITKYQYRQSADDGTNWNPDWTDISGSGATTTSHTVTPLDNGTDYTFEVRAVNPVGNGAVSGDTATPNPRPDAPGNFEAAPDDRRVALSWDDPSDSSITKYQYRQSANGGTSWNPDWTDISGSGATTTSHTVTPLDNGTEYTFEVRAVNPTGDGSASRDIATPNPRPAAPGSFNAAPDDRRVALSWDDPSDSSITKYRYRVSSDGGTSWDPDWRDIPSSSASTTTYTVTPLDNGTDYTFEVRAVNPTGEGAVSSDTATPNPRPVAPANFEAAPANRQVTLNWDDPRDNSIAKYQYRVSADGGTSWTPNWTDVPSSGAGTTTHTITPLDNGTEYTFEVRAVNPTGDGSASRDIATPNPRPAAPGSFNAAPDDRRVALSWDDPGDSSITKYQHRYRKTRETNWDPNWTDITGSGATTTSHTITSLDNGTSYTFEVRAVNPVDNGAGARAAATPWPLPSAPRNLNAAPDDRRVALSWDDPSDSSASRNTSTARAPTDGTNWNPDWTDISGSGAATTNYTLTPLNNGTDYTFEVRAVNPVGNGPASGDTATPNPVPAAPGSLNAAPDDRRVALSWDDPSDSSITKYQYRQSADDGTNWNPDWTDISGSGATTTSHTVTPLDNGTDYTFEVRAVNPVGNGAVSGDTATPNPRPDAPGNFEAAPDDRRVALSWDDPRDNSDREVPVPGQSADDGTNWNPDWTDISGSGATTTSHTVTPLDNGTEYTFEVRAVNPTGDGSASRDIATPNPRPAAPGSFNAAPDDRRVALSWDDPSDSSITKYRYRVSSDGGTSWDPDWRDIPSSSASTTTYTVTPLDNGTDYTFEVRAVNPTGEGAVSSDTATPNPRPVAPANFEAAPANRQVTLNWDDPRDNSIAKYQYRVSADGGTSWTPNWTDVPSSGAGTTTHTITPLDNGTEYTFEVRAVNPTGDGSASRDIATPNPRPAAPGSFNAAPDDRRVALSWDDPGDSSITKYQHRYRKTRETNWDPNWTDITGSGATTTSHTITSLDNGTSYTFEVRAVNPVDNGAGARAAATPWPLPSAPRNLNAAPDDRRVALSWDDPSDSSITKYQYRVSADDGTNWNPDWTDISGSGAATTSYTLTPLNNGTDYTFEVRAVNPVGNGPASGDTATPNPVPAAPGSFNAAPDDRRVALSWDDPSDSSITKYQYRQSADDGTNWNPDWTDISGSGATTTSHTVTPLDNGTDYTFEVRAVNPVGNGAVSGDTATPNPRPDAPGNFEAAPDDRRVALSWDDPSDSSITKYQYRQSANGGTSWNPDWTDIAGSGAGTTTHTITPLDNGTEYTFEVRAVNPTGDGSASRDIATPNPRPAAPGSFNAAPDDRRVALSWDDPSDSSITKYRYRVSSDGGTSWDPDWRDIPSSSASTTTYTVTPLDNGTDYTFEVRAVNPTGEGAVSSDTATPNPRPVAPANFEAAPANRQVTLNWDDPRDNSIAKYQYRVSADDGTNWNPDWTDISGSGAATTSYTLTPLNNGTDYTFEVRAVNPVGNGPASGDTATPNPVPAAPGSFNAAPDDRRVALSWDDPSDSSITKYQYRQSANGGTNWNPDWTDIAGSGAGTTSHTITPLDNGTEYTFEVRAVNPVGEGAVSSDTATPNPRPVAPANFEAAPANRQVTLNWDDPRDNSIAKYQYRVSADGGTSWDPDWGDIPSSGASTTTYTVTPLDNGADYTFEVRAVNPTGEGPASSDMATPNPRPAAPANFNAASRDAGVSLNWDDPGDSSITKYQHRYRKTRETNWDPNWTDITGSGATTTSHTITQLDNGTEYTFEVRAVNPVDNGAGARAAATPWPRPTAPGSLNAAPDDRRVTLRWDDPSDASITKYQYRQSANGGTSWTPSWTDIAGSGAATTSYTLTPLDNGTEYTFEVRAVNPTGGGAVSSDTATPNPRPAAPGSLNAAPDDRRVTLSWDDPSDASITKYQYRQSANDGTNWTPNWTDIAGSSATTTSHTVTPLDIGTSYTFEVRAVNPVGYGAGARASATPFGPPDVPLAPDTLQTLGRDGALYISWHKPAEDPRAKITSFDTRYRRYGSSSRWRNATSTSVDQTPRANYFQTIGGLDNRRPYEVQVAGVNSVGRGPWAAATGVPQADFRYGPPADDGNEELDLGPLNASWTDRLNSDTFHPDQKRLNINVIENSCMAPATFRIFWDSQDKAAREYEADIQTREGAGEFTYQFGTETFMSNNTLYKQGYIYGTTSLHRNSTLSVRVRARFDPEGWSTWSKPVNLLCFVTDTPATSQQLAEGDNSPATGRPAIAGAARVGETMSATTSDIADPDGLTSATFSYQWNRGDGSTSTDITDATAATYTLREGDLDYQVSVTVAFTDDEGNDETLTSAPILVLAATPLSGAFDSATLPGEHDGSSAFSFEIYFSEEPVLGFEDVRDHVLDVTNGDVASVRRTTPGSNIRWEITVQPDGNDEVTLLLPVTDNCDDEGAVCTASEKKLLIGAAIFVRGPAASQEQTAANTAATGTPAVTGTAQVGETLTADTSGIADENGLDNASFSYQWLRNDGTSDAVISGATGSSYTVHNDDGGRSLRVRVSFTDDDGFEESLTSGAAAVPVPTPLTASFDAGTVPGSHDGSTAFTLEFRFNKEPSLEEAAVRDHVLTVTGGEVTGARQTTQGSGLRWVITVQPEGQGGVTVALPRTTDCGDQGAVCTRHGQMLSQDVSTTVNGPEPEEEEEEQGPTEPPPAPTDLTGTIDDDGSITISWTAPEDDSVTGYQILRRRPLWGETELEVYVDDSGSRETSYRDTNTVEHTRYVYRVKARNSAGLSEWSNFVGLAKE